jgi:Lipase (class 3)
MSLNPGFNLSEALNLVALSAIVEGGDAPPQPVGWSMAFDSPVIGPFTEKWQLWKNDAGAYAVVLRDIRRQYGRERPFRICLLLKDPQNGILVQLADKVPQGSAIFIAGHSQEAAMATLLRSYHAYGADAPKDKNYSYKTYVFAQPKPGNDHYAADFESAFCKAGLAFRISNSLDWVPRSRLRLSFTSISPTSSAL